MTTASSSSTCLARTGSAESNRQPRLDRVAPRQNLKSVVLSDCRQKIRNRRLGGSIMSASKNTARSFIAKKVSLYPGGHMKIVSSVLTTGPMIRPRNYTLQHPLIAKAYDSLPDSTKKNGAKILKDIPVDLYRSEE